MKMIFGKEKILLDKGDYTIYANFQMLEYSI